MTRRLIGKNALVTGATSNIGRSIAERLGAEGAHVIVSGRDRERGDVVVTAIRRNGGRADFVAADLDGSAEASHRLADAALSLLGSRIDVLVNNAGIYPLHSTPSADELLFDAIFGVNLKAPFLLTQAIIPHMIESGGGAVINLGSWITNLAVPSSPLYASSKGAMETLTRAWSAEFGAKGVRVNAVSPGVIRAREDGSPAHRSAGMMTGTPAGGPGQPDAVAAAVAFLASDEAEFIHGTVLDVDGGRANVHSVA
ncbi:SDR family NAD(P)-dependent oxidoreductase [Leifsonia aquatica]|uniref:SDR family NAD(P)-dependent oxidoreductase n=1 Tax=Leifsonia aquatica TaxID=144185 RepID=UPI00384F4559